MWFLFSTNNFKDLVWGLILTFSIQLSNAERTCKLLRCDQNSGNILKIKKFKYCFFFHIFICYTLQVFVKKNQPFTYI